MSRGPYRFFLVYLLLPGGSLHPPLRPSDSCPVKIFTTRPASPKSVFWERFPGCCFFSYYTNSNCSKKLAVAIAAGSKKTGNPPKKHYYYFLYRAARATPGLWTRREGKTARPLLNPPPPWVPGPRGYPQKSEFEVLPFRNRPWAYLGSPPVQETGNSTPKTPLVGRM